jgi:hypothetical protein
VKDADAVAIDQTVRDGVAGLMDGNACERIDLSPASATAEDFVVAGCP